MFAVVSATAAGIPAGRAQNGDAATVPTSRQLVATVESSTVFHGPTAAHTLSHLVSGGPSVLHAAVMEERHVLELAQGKEKGKVPLVAIYPREGTAVFDHPVATVNRRWVTAAHRQAAAVYIDFLRSETSQKKAAAFFFRPGNPAVSADPTIFRVQAGVTPDGPTTVLPSPTVPFMRISTRQWRAVKKPLRVVLVIDTSGSMAQDKKLAEAKFGAIDLLSQLDERDEVAVLGFGSRPYWVVRQAEPMTPAGRLGVARAIQGLAAGGETALYDAVVMAHNELRGVENRITTLVVLSDGADNRSQTPIAQTLRRIQYDPEGSATRVFTIAYGLDADKAVLTLIGRAGAGETYEGTPQTIHQVFRKIFLGF
jgi:Ca-activated chloride channel family protein